MFKRILQRIFKFAAYTAAGLVILLAVLVGLFRLFLPRLPEYQEEIKLWASNAIGMQVEFDAMDARWGLRGPELKFYGAELIRTSNDTRAVAAREVGVGVSLIRLLEDRTLVVDTITISETSIELRQLEDSSWQVQGTPFAELFATRPPPDIGSISVIADDVSVALIRPGDERPRYFDITRIIVERDADRTAIDADLRLPASIGRSMRVSATQIASADTEPEPWHLTFETGDLDLGGLSELAPAGMPTFGSGRGRLDLDMALVGSNVLNATANLDFSSVSLGEGQTFDISGRIESTNDPDGWLLAAEDLRIASASGVWPETSLRLEASTDENGEIVVVDARASYLNLDDVGLIVDWLDDDQRRLVDELSPDGIVREFEATLSDADTDEPNYSLTAIFDGAGVAAWQHFPGIRNFTGRLRADSAGGLLDVAGEYMVLSLPEYLSLPVDIDAAEGTIIWRRSDDRITILSDNITVRNSILDSQNNIQITVQGDDAPVVDFASSWSIEDISAAKRYIPGKIMQPKLYDWFQAALVEGRMPGGTTRLIGPLDKFPFDEGEGQFLIEADVRNMTFQYLPNFPAARFSELNVVLDRMRLYTTSNRSISRGNTTIDADVEIADLREPVLTIDAFSTGTLDSLKSFAADSPVAGVFGGQLDRVTVSGEASMRLDLIVPIKDWRSFDFTASILSNNGTLAVAGLPAPVTDLSGAVTVGRQQVSSEALGGRFLGEPVSFEVRNAGEDLPRYRVVATASGIATGQALVEELGVPMRGQLGGATTYNVDILFPDSAAETPVPMSIQVSSDLAGLTIEMPEPFTKTAAESLPFDGRLDFMPGGLRITSRGQIGDNVGWDLAFESLDGAWDFDRGLLRLGSEPVAVPEVRGLHIAGTTPEVRLERWLRLGRNKNERLGLAERVRSVNLEIGTLYALGQRLEAHSVQLDRSARDWLVQVDGPLVSGSLFVPYDFEGGRSIVVDMERMILPGDDEAPERDAPAIDPRSLPALSLAAKEFGIGNRYFGNVVAEFQKTSAGLSADNLVATDPTFEIIGSAGWVAQPEDPLGSQSYITATLESTNVVETMRRLDYQPGIESADLGVLVDISWSGGPRLDFLDSMNGEVQVRLGTGQLVEVEPGAGRVFGLMSIVALPRRLSLDFRDVFEKGFGFDEIAGTFSIVDGVASTCNLGLEGPAADIAIIGSVDLVDKRYSQSAVVSANVGNALPVVGAVVAGPQAAAALLIFSQIFKKPLQEVGQLYYDVTGAWEDPAIESSNADGFAERARLTGCIEQTG